MKKIYALAVSLAVATLSFAQSPRTTLVEEATNASCPPCAAQNPGFNALLEANTDNVVSIKYQAPYPGYDPMNEHNPAQVMNRMNYYPGITGVPTAMLDGEVITDSYPGFLSNAYAGAPGAYTQATLDHATSFTSPFEVDVDYTLTEDEITITAGATCTEATSGDLKYHVVVIEKKILFNSAPGSNGETKFENVMKKMLPTADGEQMADSYEVGDEFSITESWTLSNVYNLDQVAVVVYIQNDDTKEVLQAGEAFKPYYTLDAGSISASAGVACEGSVNPSVVIRNNGSEELNSLNINYELNDASGTVNWTGDLAFDESETVSLGDITFTPETSNTIEITISDPNSGEDEKTENNTTSANVIIAAESTLDITVEIRTDFYAGETSWEIRNSNDEVVASAAYTGPANGGGPDANTTKTHEIMLDPFDCYKFTLMDGYGDGMGYGSGAPFGYRIIDGYGTVILENLANDNNFGLETSAGIATADAVNINEASINSSLNLYPNPANDKLNIAFELENSDNISIDVYNLVGQVVMSQNLGTITSGYTLENIDVSDLKSGFYLVNINTSDATIVRKITVSK